MKRWISFDAALDPGLRFGAAVRSEIELLAGDPDSIADQLAAEAIAARVFQNKTIDGDLNAISDIGIASLKATGTPNNTTYLRGDGTWSTPAGGGGGSGFSLVQTAEKTGNYTAAPNESVLINATGTLTITAPSAPAGGDLLALYIRAGSAQVTFAANSGQELRFDGSAVTSLVLQGSGLGTIGLSLWKYQTGGAVWFPVSYTTIPVAADIVDSGAAGRLVLQADTEAEIRTAAGLVIGTDVMAYDPRTTPRVSVVASSGTPTLNLAAGDWHTIAVANNITSIGVTGTPANLQPVNVRLKGTGTYTYAFGSSWSFAYGHDAPLGTVNNRFHYLTGRWNPDTSKIDVLGVAASA